MVDRNLHPGEGRAGPARPELVKGRFHGVDGHSLRVGTAKALAQAFPVIAAVPDDLGRILLSVSRTPDAD